MSTTYSWFQDDGALQEQMQRELEASKELNQKLDELHERLFKKEVLEEGPQDYSEYLLRAPFPSASTNLWRLIEGEPARRVAYMRGLRELRRPHRRAWRFLRRKTYPVRHPWKAHVDRIVEKHGYHDY